jgi:hypothetical protein
MSLVLSLRGISVFLLAFRRMVTREVLRLPFRAPGFWNTTLSRLLLFGSHLPNANTTEKRHYNCGNYNCGNYNCGNYTCGNYTCGNYFQR